DYPIRKLFIASLYDDEQPWESYNKIKLTEDDDKRVIINDMATSDWLKINNRQDWVIEEVWMLGASAADEFWITPTYNVSVADGNAGADQAGFVDADGYGGVVHYTFAAGEIVQFLIRGLCPHGATEIPFGKQYDPGDWYDVHMRKNVKLDLTTGSTASTDATIQVFLQQFRTY
ncbi:unnamed protein product, partial [marine sediment metagenome]